MQRAVFEKCEEARCWLLCRVGYTEQIMAKNCTLGAFYCRPSVQNLIEIFSYILKMKHYVSVMHGVTSTSKTCGFITRLRKY